jgi:hypothetical protein
VARSIRRAAVTTALALAWAGAAWPASAAAEDPLQPVLNTVLDPVVAVPAATLPSVSVVLNQADPSRPADSGSASPQAYIKDRVVLRVFRGTVLRVDTASAQVVVRTVRRRASGRIVKRRQTFGLTGARLKVADVNGDGVTSIADIERGDRVRLRAAVRRGPLRAAVPLAVRDFVDKGQPVHSKRRGRKLR